MSMSAVYADFGGLVNHGRNILSFYLKISRNEDGSYRVEGSDVRKLRLIIRFRVLLDLLQEWISLWSMAGSCLSVGEYLDSSSSCLHGI